MRKIYFVLLLILSACSPNSIQEFQFEGEGIAKKLLHELARVHSLSDLKKEGPNLKKEYAHLIDVMIAAKKYQDRHPDDEVPSQIGFEVSEALKKEFMRIYQLEGCAEVMEALQRESLHKLDSYHQRREALKIQTFR